MSFYIGDAQVHNTPFAVIAQEEAELRAEVAAIRRAFGALAAEILLLVINRILRAMGLGDFTGPLDGALTALENALLDIPKGNVTGLVTQLATIAQDIQQILDEIAQALEAAGTSTLTGFVHMLRGLLPAAIPGFNVIATANDRDRGVNELSSALRRRFNTVVLPLPATAEEEVAIVSRRVSELGRALELPSVDSAEREIRRVVRIFRELRAGVTEDGKTSLKTPSGTLSTAEAISVVASGMALAAHFGDGDLQAADLAAGIVGSVVRDPTSDQIAWTEYLENVVKQRSDWADFYRACREAG